MPITVRLVWQATSLGSVGQAAFLAITVRYGAMRTVKVVVTYAELAQSYQYQALWWGVSLIRTVPTGCRRCSSCGQPDTGGLILGEYSTLHRVVSSRRAAQLAN